MVAGSWASFGAGAAVGALVGAQTYILSSTLSIGAGTMNPRSVNMKDFALSVGLGALFGGPAGKAYNPQTYWSWRPTYHNTPEGRAISPHARWRMHQRGISGGNIDEVVSTGQAWKDVAHESDEFIKAISQMQTRVDPSHGGKFIQVAQVWGADIIKTVMRARKAP